MASIFLSYRRDDAPTAVRELYERLVAEFRAHQVFRDHDSIEPGEHFRRVIRDAIGASEVVLVVIGRHWSAARLHQPEDVLCHEIASALALGKLVIPVLVEGGKLPDAHELPEPVRPLLQRNAAELSERHWEADLDSLMSRIPLRRSRLIRRLGDLVTYVRDALATLGTDLVELLAGPRGFLARRRTGRTDDLRDAFACFVFGVALGTALVFTAIDLRASPLGVVLVSLQVAAVGTLLLSFPLWLAWWLVGQRAHYLPVLTVLLYQTGIGALLAGISGVLGWGSMQVNDPTQLTRALEAARRLAVDEAFAIASEPTPSLNAPAIVLAGLSLSVVVWLGTWMLRSWGAYRDALGASRLRSTTAFAGLCAILLSPVWGVYLLGLLWSVASAAS